MNESYLYRGRSKEEAERYGKPCIGAHYNGRGVHDYRKDVGAKCAVCGAPATDVHHWPPIGKSYHGEWCLRTPKGWHVLMPSLFALCRHCHRLFHDMTLQADWVWDTKEAERDYWSGKLTSQRKYMPHSPYLYELGHWEFKDPRYNRGFTYREVVKDGEWKAVRGQIRQRTSPAAGSHDED